MHRITMLAVVALATLTVPTCDDSSTDIDDSPQLQYGVPVNVGNGQARAYVLLDTNNGDAPLEIGIALSEEALDGLPAPGAHPEHMDSYSYTLPLPQQMPSPYEVVELNWNAGGHPPPHVYDQPHFDFHFYTISLAERNAIQPSDPAFAAKAAQMPSADFVPPGYAVLPPPPAPVEAVPMMGVHWIDVTAPEIQPADSPDHRAFTRTFIYGSWDGQFTFVEPMVTRAYLLSGPDERIPISTPASYESPGYYPGAYHVKYDAQAKEYRVALADLTLHQ
ncbi:MAG: DUF5602 domain-containing protein [Longimicrobiales bacterium]